MRYRIQAFSGLFLDLLLLYSLLRKVYKSKLLLDFHPIFLTRVFLPLFSTQDFLPINQTRMKLLVIFLFCMLSGLSTATPFENGQAINRYIAFGVKDFSKLGPQEVVINYSRMWYVNGKIVEVQVGYRLSGSGDDSLFEIRLHSKQKEGKEYALDMTLDVEFETPDGKKYKKIPFAAPLSNEEPTTKWFQTLDRKTILKDIVDPHDYFMVIIRVKYIPKK